MKFLKTGTWVLVADGGKALFLRNNGTARDYDLRVVWHQAMENPATRDQGTDRPGRARSSAGGHRAALEEADWHELAEEGFAREIAAILDKAAQDGVFEEIVIAAAPPVLGALRGELGALAAGRVIAEIPKTLANHPIEKIEEILRKELEAT